MNRNENVEMDDGNRGFEKIRTEEIRATAAVANIREKIREARLRWLCHVENLEVCGHRKKGRPKLKGSDVI